jgi:two-component system, chemotaxis family, chemotaxis protein CheY
MTIDQSSEKRCVIADDVRASREMLSVWLQEYGYECVLVPDGEAAKEEVDRNPPSLVITDIEMPKCNGLELLSVIRSHPKAHVRRIPVIVISSLRDEKMIDVVKSFGGTSVMCKPLERLRVRDVLHAIESGTQWVESYLIGLHSETQIPAVSPKLRRMAQNIERNFDS